MNFSVLSVLKGINPLAPWAELPVVIDGVLFGRMSEGEGETSLPVLSLLPSPTPGLQTQSE